jgi:hypothetical protein
MGSAFSTIGLDPIPDPADAVMVPADFAMYANAIDHKLIHYAQDQADRDVLYAAAAAPLFVVSPTALWFKVSGSGGGSVWKTLWSDTGNVSSGITAGTDFQYVSGYVRKIFNIVFFTVQVQRKNSVLDFNAYNHGTSPGNLPGDPIAFTLPTAYWPDHVVETAFRANTADGVAEVNTNGTVELLSGTPSGDIAIDELVVVSATYMIP